MKQCKIICPHCNEEVLIQLKEDGQIEIINENNIEISEDKIKQVLNKNNIQLG